MATEQSAGDVRYDLERRLDRLDGEIDEVREDLRSDLRATDDRLDELSLEVFKLRESLADAWSAIVELREQVRSRSEVPR